MIRTDNKPSKGSNGGKQFSAIAGEIEFREVCFAYPSRPNMVFENLSFTIGAGKSIAIVGPSGSGKSTIISMVQRFYDPTSGIYYHAMSFNPNFTVIAKWSKLYR